MAPAAGERLAMLGEVDDAAAAGSPRADASSVEGERMDGSDDVRDTPGEAERGGVAAPPAFDAPGLRESLGEDRRSRMAVSCADNGFARCFSGEAFRDELREPSLEPAGDRSVASRA